MKKLVALLCAVVMVMSLSSAVMAKGSITGPVTGITATTPDGKELQSTSIADLSSADLDAAIKSTEVRAIVDSYLSGDPEKAMAGIKALAGEDPKTTSGKSIDLDKCEPVDTMSLISTDDISVDPVTVNISVTTDFQLSEGKSIEDYVVAVINPETGEVTFVEPTADADGKVAYELPFYPALAQMMEIQ